MKNYNKQSGFSLIEVLVTMLILAIGLLALASLQLRGLQYSGDANIRTKMSFLAYEIAELMTMQGQNAPSFVGGYNVPTVWPAADVCSTTVHTVANDLICWRRKVFAYMPAGSQVRIASRGREFTVRFRWDGRDGIRRRIGYTFVL